MLHKEIVALLYPVIDDLFILNRFPIPTCLIKRAFSKLNPFAGVGSVGYGSAKREKYFGFKGQLIISSQGIPLSLEIAPANIDETDILPEVAKGLTGTLVAGKGLIRPRT